MPVAAAVGGGGAPGVSLASAAVALPARSGRAAAAGPRPLPVVGRVEHGRLLLDLIAVSPEDDQLLVGRRTPSRGTRRGQGVVHVVATAGHVDHGKSALVRALTGTRPRPARGGAPTRSVDPARLRLDLPARGRRRRLRRRARPRALHHHDARRRRTGAGRAVRGRRRRPVDAPGGRAPGRARRADVSARRRRRHAQRPRRPGSRRPPGWRRSWRRPSLRGSPVVPVSSRTGAGLDALRARPGRAGARPLPQRRPAAPTCGCGSTAASPSAAPGTVVTGTLPAGTVAGGDTLGTGTGDRPRAGRRRRSERDGRRRCRASPGWPSTARRRRGPRSSAASADHPGRLSTGPRSSTSRVDRVTSIGCRSQPMLHVGARSVSVHGCRPLDGDLVRLTLRATRSRCACGDRALLRDPGQPAGVGRARPRPAAAAAAPARRGASTGPRRAAGRDRRAGSRLRGADGARWWTSDTLRRIGVPGSPAAAEVVVRAGRWLMSADRAERTADQVLQTRHRARPRPSARPRAAAAVLADAPGLPSPELVAAVLRAAAATWSAVGCSRPMTRASRGARAGPRCAGRRPGGEPVRRAHRRPAPRPRARRDADAAAAKAGRLLRLAPGIVLLPGADAGARWKSWRSCPSRSRPARHARGSGTSRRVVLPCWSTSTVPGLTRRLPDDRRIVVEGGGGTAPRP